MHSQKRPELPRDIAAVADLLARVRARIILEGVDETQNAQVQAPSGGEITLPSGRLLLRVHEVAKALAVSRSAVYALIRSGEIPSLKIGRSTRVSVDVLQRWFARASKPVDESVRLAGLGASPASGRRPPKSRYPVSNLGQVLDALDYYPSEGAILRLRPQSNRRSVPTPPRRRYAIHSQRRPIVCVHAHKTRDPHQSALPIGRGADVG